MSNKLSTPKRNASGIAGDWKRADELNLGDQIVLGTEGKNGRQVVIATVRTLALAGDDVVIEFFGSLVGETTTSIGNEFLVVEGLVLN